LLNISAHAGRFYKPFHKRSNVRPFAQKDRHRKSRLIDKPTGLLKVLQSRITDRLLKQLIFPEHLLGGIPGKSIAQNTSLHFGAPYLVTIDIKDFFPSITPEQIYMVWKDVLNCSPEIARTLTKITTFRGRLPQGAPTSTLLANLVLGAIDAPIRAACNAKQVRYSSFVDDLAFSGHHARDVVPSVINILRESGFSVAHRKIKVMGPGNKKTINGLTLGRFIRADKGYSQRIRAGIHNLEIGKVSEAEVASYVASLEGQISYVGLFDTRKATRLREDLAHAKSARVPIAEKTWHYIHLSLRSRSEMQ